MCILQSDSCDQLSATRLMIESYSQTVKVNTSVRTQGLHKRSHFVFAARVQRFVSSSCNLELKMHRAGPLQRLRVYFLHMHIVHTSCCYKYSKFMCEEYPHSTTCTQINNKHTVGVSSAVD